MKRCAKIERSDNRVGHAVMRNCPQGREVVISINRRNDDACLTAETNSAFIMIRAVRPFPSTNGWTSAIRNITKTARENGASMER